LKVSIVIPCLNEAETLAICIEKAFRALDEQHIDGEIVVADNGSTDGSPEIAKRSGACVIHVAARGYGNALMHGIAARRVANLSSWAMLTALPMKCFFSLCVCIQGVVRQ